MRLIERRASFQGWQEVYEHPSTTLGCNMRFAVYLPPQAAQQKVPVVYWLSGLTCTEQNFITKAGAQQAAAQLGLIIVAPDTSPRGADIADDAAYDLGQGAGFYINATQEPWAQHYHMYDYIVHELPALIQQHFPSNGKASIMGHSMGGHGALLIGLRNPQQFHSISAFSPIVAPSQTPWGQKAFTQYLGAQASTWTAWDSTEIVKSMAPSIPILIDQGLNDEFLEKELQTERFAAACQAYPQVTIRMQPHYDHSYYFIASFIGEHLEFHAKALS